MRGAGQGHRDLPPSGRWPWSVPGRDEGGRIGQGLGRSPARARQLHWRAVTSIALAPLGPDPTWSPHRRACGVAVQPATAVLGDPTDPQAPARMRAFVDQALPHMRPKVSAQLLIKLADLVELEVDLLAWGRDHALCRAIAPSTQP
jgi:hypothetical protein